MASVDELVAEFNGAIKYMPMIKDHPDWTKEQCLEFAKKWHAVAIERLRKAIAMEKEGHGSVQGQSPLWNNGIPYCRNIPTTAMLDEADK